MQCLRGLRRGARMPLAPPGRLQACLLVPLQCIIHGGRVQSSTAVDTQNNTVDAHARLQHTHTFSFTTHLPTHPPAATSFSSSVARFSASAARCRTASSSPRRASAAACCAAPAARRSAPVRSTAASAWLETLSSRSSLASRASSWRRSAVCSAPAPPCARRRAELGLGRWQGLPL